jgi:8-oxo-dGTP pyrophosphatase MutT (NUDIX family)
MNDKLIWNEEGRKTVFTCPVFTVEERYCRSPNGGLKTFSALGTKDWAIVIPVLETVHGREFIMVKQWRHGSRELSVEFPGGVFEKGENAEEAALRELLEETGYAAKRIEKLGEFNPNPAIMSNKVHFFLASELAPPVKQHLDEDEYVEVLKIQQKDVMENMGKPPYSHALMGTAMALFLKKERS